MNRNKALALYLLGTLGQIWIICFIVFVLRSKGLVINYTTIVGLVAIGVGGNIEASNQQDCNGQNIGMFAVEGDMPKAVLKALDNKVASRQQDGMNGWNIGMYAANSEMEEATIKALQDSVASIQQDDYGYNIGMHAVAKDLKDAVLVSLENYGSRIQGNARGFNIYNLIESRMRNYPEVYNKAMELRDLDVIAYIPGVENNKNDYDDYDEDVM